MKTDTPISWVRRKARERVLAVISNYVLGPPECLHHGDVLMLRRQLRTDYPFASNDLYSRRIWREEVRAALGFIVNRPKRKRRPMSLFEHEIMPAMRPWAEKQGIIIRSNLALERQSETL